MTVGNGKSAFGRLSGAGSAFSENNRLRTGETGRTGDPASFLPLVADLTVSKEALMAHELVCLFLAIDDPQTRERCLDFVRQQAATNPR